MSSFSGPLTTFYLPFLLKPSNFLLHTVCNIVAETVIKMRQCKAPCPSGITAEKFRASDKVTISILASLTNAIIAEKNVPGEWDL